MNFEHYDPEKLRGLREAKSLTQRKVAEHLNIDRRTVLRAEAGISVSYELLCALCDLYEADVVDLLYSRRVGSCQVQANLMVGDISCLT